MSDGLWLPALTIWYHEGDNVELTTWFMKQIFLFIILAAWLTPLVHHAQVYVGFGGGIDYGGLGMQTSYLPAKQVAIFAGVGYNLNSVGYNFGAELKIPTEKRVSPYLIGMYGYNAVLQVEGYTKSETTYYGPSFGGGVQIKFKHSANSFLQAGVLLPIRPQVFHDAIDDLKLAGYEVKDPLPVAISIGYHIKLNW